MLVTQYGNFETCPKIIRGKILEKEGAIMTEDLRNKLRYLRHLPVTCNFEVCEIILDDAVVGKETEALFKEQLDVRHNRRRRRARDEKRREKRILVEENKLMGKFPDTKHRIESEFHFPEVGSNMSLGLVSAAAAALYNSRESLDSTLSTSPMPTMSGEAGGLSFARMLRKSSAGIASVRRNETASPIQKGTFRPRLSLVSATLLRWHWTAPRSVLSRAAERERRARKERG
jgi:hypothetical protein